MKGIEKARIVLVPYPAQGHVTPIVQLALVLRDRGFEPMIVTPDFVHRRIISQIQSEDGVVFMSIPDGLDEKDPCDFVAIRLAMEKNMPIHLDRILSRLGEDGGVACVIVDLLASWAIEVANRCRVPVAGFWPAMLATYHLITSIPNMIKFGVINEFGSPQHQGTGSYLPGQTLLSTNDLPWLVGNSAARKSRFEFWMRTLDRSRALQWILVNSFPEECDGYKQHHHPIKSIQDHPRVFQVGPLSRHAAGSKNPSFWEEDRSCLDWVDKQKPGSVIYVSFGSWVGPIGEENLNELALGLEATRRPFIWALAPTWRKGLPIGYLERVAEQGKVVSWAPQKELLQREAIGCFLTHCGWNSTMEAIQCGKRLLCYPVSGDQFLNCKYIVKVWGIGAKMDGVKRRDVEEGVRRVMEEDGADEMHHKVMKLKDMVMGKEDSSRTVTSLTAFVDDLNKLIN